MSNVLAPAAGSGPRVMPAADAPSFSVPARHNPRLQALVERINADEELRQLWRCANVNAAERLGWGDCGEVHVRIVANAALKLLRLLREAGQVPGIVAHHRLGAEDAEVVVVLAAALHDLGLAIHPDARLPDLSLAERVGRELLNGLYPVRERTIVLAETLHAIRAQLGGEAGLACLTLEAGVLRLADTLDLAKGRVRVQAEALPSEAAAPGVDEVTIHKARQPPVRVSLHVAHTAGLAAIEALLRRELRQAGLGGWVELVASVDGQADARAVVPLLVW